MSTLEATSIILCVTGFLALVVVRMANKLLMDQLDRTAMLEKQVYELTTRVAILEHDMESLRRQKR